MLRAFAQENGITHTIIPPYHLQVNSVERINRILKTMIIAFLDQNHCNWDINFCFAYALRTIFLSALALNLGCEFKLTCCAVDVVSSPKWS